MLEILFVWMGLGALTLLFCFAGFGSVGEEETSVNEIVAILLMFLILWPYCWARTYLEREDFNL